MKKYDIWEFRVIIFELTFKESSICIDEEIKEVAKVIMRRIYDRNGENKYKFRSLKEDFESYSKDMDMTFSRLNINVWYKVSKLIDAAIEEWFVEDDEQPQNYFFKKSDKFELKYWNLERNKPQHFIHNFYKIISKKEV